MAKDQAIVFCSAYTYLANPQYFSVAPQLKDYKTIYLDVNDPVGTVFNKTFYHDKKQILAFFDHKNPEISSPPKEKQATE